MLSCCLVAAACSNEEPSAPLAPGSGGGSGTRIAGSAVDAGQPGPVTRPDDDAGTEESPSTDECENIEPVDSIDDGAPPGRFNNAIEAPSDFSVTRVEATWQPGCAQPTVRITLSNGECPDGQGHELVFLIEADAIASSGLLLGLNTLQEEPSEQGLRIRYRRPATVEPAGEWGTCGGVDGTLDLFDALELERGARLRGLFRMDLTRCDGLDDPTGIAQYVSGAFDVELRRGLADVCP